LVGHVCPSRNSQSCDSTFKQRICGGLNDESNESKIEEQDLTVDISLPEELVELEKKEVARWKKLVETVKITID
jgi:tripartite-type tricarboxylate transporter receptor subunit TctC